MKCNGCNEEILDSDPYYYGYLIPEADAKSVRTFGCEACQKYCMTCMENMPTFFNKYVDEKK